MYGPFFCCNIWYVRARLPFQRGERRGGGVCSVLCRVQCSAVFAPGSPYKRDISSFAAAAAPFISFFFGFYFGSSHLTFYCNWASFIRWGW